MLETKVGEFAGLIWNALNEKEMNLKDLKKATKIPLLSHMSARWKHHASSAFFSVRFLRLFSSAIFTEGPSDLPKGPSVFSEGPSDRAEGASVFPSGRKVS